jgi:hypothetical protein
MTKRAPLIIAIVLLLLPVLYVGSDFALVVPNAWQAAPTRNGNYALLLSIGCSPLPLRWNSDSTILLPPCQYRPIRLYDRQLPIYGSLPMCIGRKILSNH